MARRGASGLSGMLLVDKPAGITSHDVVDRVRRLAGERRVGHAGTLDPAATGLLVVLVGPATRLASFLTAADKSYEAVVRFGTRTDTDDADGEVIVTADMPEALFDPEAAEAALERLVGRSMQTPPSFSAIKKDGVVAHRAARTGSALELSPRAIDVKEARLLGVDAETGTWAVEFRVSKGTYIRALARDLGDSVGGAAHLAALRRTRSGGLTVADALTLDELESRSVAASFTDPLEGLDMPSLRIEPGDIADGRALPSGDPGLDEGTLVALYDEEHVYAVYRVSGERLVAHAVFAEGVSRGERA